MRVFACFFLAPFLPSQALLLYSIFRYPKMLRIFPPKLHVLPTLPKKTKEAYPKAESSTSKNVCNIRDTLVIKIETASFYSSNNN